MKVLAIDPGIVNVGVASCEFTYGNVVNYSAGTVSIVPTIKRLSSQKQMELIKDWININEKFFDLFDCIIIEKQMRLVFNVFVLLFELKYPTKMYVVSSRKATNYIKDRLGYLLTKEVKQKRNYEENKQFVTDIYESFFDKHPRTPRIHHTADALKLCDYYLLTVGNMPHSQLLINK